MKWKKLYNFLKQYNLFIHYFVLYVLLKRSNAIRWWLFKFKESVENFIWNQLKEKYKIDQSNKYMLFFEMFCKHDTAMFNSFFYSQFLYSIDKKWFHWIVFDFVRLIESKRSDGKNKIFWIYLLDDQEWNNEYYSDISYFLKYSIFKELKFWKLLIDVKRISKKHFKNLKINFVNWYRWYKWWYFQHLKDLENNIKNNKKWIIKKIKYEEKMIIHYLETYLNLYEDINKFNDRKEFFELCNEFIEVTLLFLDLFKQNYIKYWKYIENKEKLRQIMNSSLKLISSKETKLNNEYINEIQKYLDYFNLELMN